MSFEPLARHYHWMEALLAGNRLHQCRTAFLPEVQNAGSALLVGEGHGRFLAELAARNSNAQIICLEQSAGMIEAAKTRLKRAALPLENVRFIQTDISDFTPGSIEPVNLLATHFFLDCFNEQQLPGIIQKLAATLRPGGSWIISDFRIPNAGWKAVRAKLVLTLAYTFFRIATRLPAHRLVSPGPYLLTQHLRLESERRFNFDLLYAQLWRSRPSEPRL